MCEYRLGDFCFNPEHLDPGVLARFWKEVPCCNKDHSQQVDNSWKPVKKAAPAFSLF